MNIFYVSVKLAVYRGDLRSDKCSRLLYCRFEFRVSESKPAKVFFPLNLSLQMLGEYLE
jgi:hypothetical protein